MRVLGRGHSPRIEMDLCEGAAPFRPACMDTSRKSHLRSRLCRPYIVGDNVRKWEDTMAWTTPVLVEICVGLEINGYMPADGYVPPEF
jgi:coenzyme PQQ precursor peptide PqqA